MADYFTNEVYRKARARAAAGGGTGHTAPITFIDQYGTTQHAENDVQKQAFIDMQKNRRLRKDLNMYDAQAFKYRDDLLRMFGKQADFGTGMEAGGLQTNINQFLQRRGIDTRRGGIGASLQAREMGRLQAQGAQAKLNFSSQLMQAMQNDRNAVLTGTLSFFQAMDRMNYQNELNKDFARFQQNLQRDNARWQALGSVLGLGGQILGGMFGDNQGYVPPQNFNLVPMLP